MEFDCTGVHILNFRDSIEVVRQLVNILNPKDRICVIKHLVFITVLHDMISVIHHLILGGIIRPLSNWDYQSRSSSTMPKELRNKSLFTAEDVIEHLGLVL